MESIRDAVWKLHATRCVCHRTDYSQRHNPSIVTVRRRYSLLATRRPVAHSCALWKVKLQDGLPDAVWIERCAPSYLQCPERIVSKAAGGVRCYRRSYRPGDLRKIVFSPGAKPCAAAVFLVLSRREKLSIRKRLRAIRWTAWSKWLLPSSRRSRSSYAILPSGCTVCDESRSEMVITVAPERSSLPAAASWTTNSAARLLPGTTTSTTPSLPS